MQVPPEPGTRQDLLVLDTGPIEELVLFHAVNEFGFVNLRESLKFIKDREAHEKCLQFIASFKRKTTSASVVAELNWWIRTTKEGEGRLKLWNRVYDEFRNMGMDEEVVKLLAMKPELVNRFGPVDISLTEIARRRLTERPHIFTVDDKLFHYCLDAGLQASLLQVLTRSFH